MDKARKYKLVVKSIFCDIAKYTSNNTSKLNILYEIK